MWSQLAVNHLRTEAANFAQRSWNPLVCREQIDQLKDKQQNPFIFFLMFKYRHCGTYRHSLCPWGSSLSRIAHNALCEIIASYLKSSVNIVWSASFWAQLIQSPTTVNDNVYGDSTYMQTAAGQWLSVVTWKDFFLLFIIPLLFFGARQQ